MILEILSTRTCNNKKSDYLINYTLTANDFLDQSHETVTENCSLKRQQAKKKPAQSRIKTAERAFNAKLKHDRFCTICMIFSNLEMEADKKLPRLYKT